MRPSPPATRIAADRRTRSSPSLRTSSRSTRGRRACGRSITPHCGSAPASWPRSSARQARARPRSCRSWGRSTARRRGASRSPATRWPRSRTASCRRCGRSRSASSSSSSSCSSAKRPLENVANGLIYRGHQHPRASRARGDRTRAGRPRPPPPAPRIPAVGRRTPARRGRPRGRRPPIDRLGRRTDRQSRHAPRRTRSSSCSRTSTATA